MKSTVYLRNIGFAVALTALSACGDKAPEQAAPPAASNPPQATQPEKPTVAQPQAVQLTDAAALQAAEDSLRALPQFAGKKLRFFQQATFWGSKSGLRIEINLQDPNKPENIDHYVYRNGKWEEPQPVQIRGDGKMDDNLTDLDAAKFATVAKVAEQWNAKAKEVGATEDLTVVSYRLWVPTQERYWDAEDVETPRAVYRITFDAKGDLKKFEKK